MEFGTFWLDNRFSKKALDLGEVDLSSEFELSYV